MIQALVSFSYLILVLGYILTFLFIVYHLVKYSLRPSLNTLVLPVFFIGSALILFTDISLFLMINWNAILYSLANPIK